MDAEDDPKGYRWETEYEKTWEAIRENEDGLIQPNIEEMVHKAKRDRILKRKNLRLGMMRHLFIIIDMSNAMSQQDLRPNRILCTLNLVKVFVNEFIEQNPISQLGIIITKNKRAEKITDLSGNIKHHMDGIKRISDMACFGEPSLQNAIELAMRTLKQMPSHTSKEILFIFGSLTTCDPSDIHQTINLLVTNNIRCSIIGLTAEIRICRELSKQTKGIYDVILDDAHYKELLLQHIQPPPSAMTESSLMRMGFPQYVNEGEGQPSMCVCHLNNTTNFSTSGYFCSQCGSKYCELPVECQVCGLTLVSAVHLARSYHHLFPVDIYKEYTPELGANVLCFACDQQFKTGGKCEHCDHVFCIDCDLFIHETLHLCPGCASRSQVL